MGIDGEDLPTPLTAASIREGEVNIPQTLVDFLCLVISGEDTSREVSDRALRFSQSSAADLIFETTRGRIKPAKHLLLGMGLKSMIGSRKVLEILNNLGHCVSYHIAEDLETELAITITDKGLSCPDGILRQPCLST